MTSRSLFETAPPVPEKSIAVLPFENLSDDKQNAYFADGVQDEILNDLAKVADLKVISRTSVMLYRNSVQRNLREIAKVLGVAHILEGTVQRADGRIRVSAQLIDARTDAHLWGERYDRELADVFALLVGSIALPDESLNQDATSINRVGRRSHFQTNPLPTWPIVLAECDDENCGEALDAG